MRWVVPGRLVVAVLVVLLVIEVVVYLWLLPRTG